METLKTDFKVDDIRTTITKIQARIEDMKKAGVNDAFEFEMDIMTNLPDFYHEYPFLVKTLSSGRDTMYLHKMLDSLENVQKGNTSLAHTEYTLGNELADKFINPVINKDNKNK